MTIKMLLAALEEPKWGNGNFNALTFLQNDTQFGIDKRGKFNNQFARGVYK